MIEARPWSTERIHLEALLAISVRATDISRLPYSDKMLTTVRGSIELRLGDLVPSSLKPYLKPLYRWVITLIDPKNPATLPDWLWQLETGGIVEAPKSLKDLHADAVFYQPVPYQVLPYLRSIIRQSDVFFDLGSGMGRTVLYVAGACELRKVVGIEFNPDLVNVARSNLSKLESKHIPLAPIELIEDDVTRADLSEGTAYFLFNPFGESTLLEVLENIHMSLAANPRAVRVFYVNAVFARVLDEMDWLKATHDLPRLVGRTTLRSWSALGE